MIIGIDVGLTGGIAVLTNNGEFADVLDMPVFNKKIDASGLADMIRHYTSVTVIVESVHAMPRQGVVSTCSLCRSFGVVEGVVAGIGNIKLVYTEPRAWKGRAGLLKTEKSASIQKAIEIFPAAANFLTKKSQHGRADAILIARFGCE